VIDCCLTVSVFVLLNLCFVCPFLLDNKINHIQQIIYYFCSIRHHRSHVAIDPILFFYIKKITFPPNKMVLTYTDGIAAALSIIIISKSWSGSYVSWMYNYLCNQCLSPLTL
jgi:hypothetical protein